jgi:mRNA interferase YafQ
MLRADYTTRFKKDYKLASKRGRDMSIIDRAIADIINEKPLPDRFRDHILVADYRGCHECHLQSDWLLVYQIWDGVAVFERTGTHSDLF